MAEGIVSAAIPIRARARAFLDFAPDPADVLSIVYRCTIVGAATTLRVPVSSVQATAQFNRANFIQVVVPSVEQYATQIAALLAEDQPPRIVVTKVRRLRDGSVYVCGIAEGPLGQARIDRGAQRVTASLSGYESDIEAAVERPQTRTLRGMQTVTTGQGGARARGQIDELLFPGMLVDASGTTFRAAYINLFVSGSQAYMDVGARE